MAQRRGIIDTSYLSRIIYKIHEEDASGNTIFSGTYKLMMRAQSMPSPTSTPNAVEITDFEDDSQTYTFGIKQSDMKEFTGNLDKIYFDQLIEDQDVKVDIIQLYGRDGLGRLAKSGYVGQFEPTVNDLGGIDEVIQMTCSVVQNTSPVWITDDFAVTDNGDGTFTVASVAEPDVVLNKSNAALTVGDTLKLKATVTPAGETVAWTSSNTSYATVTNAGVVSAVGAGTATITAKITVDGVDYTDTCSVVVSAGV